MRRLILSTLSILALVTSLQAQSSTTRYYTNYANDAITIDNTAGGVALTAANITPSGKPYRAELVTFTVNCSSGSSCPIHFTLDGTTAPTTSIGLRVDYGALVNIYNWDNTSHFKAIREGSTSAVLNVSYWR